MFILGNILLHLDVECYCRYSFVKYFKKILTIKIKEKSPYLVFHNLGILLLVVLLCVHQLKCAIFSLYLP